MRIVRYELELVDYQQVQPLWPGMILAVKPGRLPSGYAYPEAAHPFQKIDMWCIDESAAPVAESSKVPVLGVWIIGTGNPIPDDLRLRIITGDHGYRDTCVMANGLVWHVFASSMEHVYPTIDTGFGEVSSVEDIANKVADRRRAELQRVADMTRDA